MYLIVAITKFRKRKFSKFYGASSFDLTPRGSNRVFRKWAYEKIVFLSFNNRDIDYTVGQTVQLISHNLERFFPFPEIRESNKLAKKPIP